MSIQMTVDEVKTLGATQMMACLDCVVASALADGKVGPKEKARLAAVIKSVPWAAAGIMELIVQQRIDMTEKKLQGFTNANQVIAFIKECATKIPGQETRRAVLFLMAAVCNADGEVNDAEKQVLGNYALAFDLGAQTVQQIAQAARDAKF